MHLIYKTWQIQVDEVCSDVVDNGEFSTVLSLGHQV